MTLPKPIQTITRIKQVVLIAIMVFILLAVTSYLWFLLPQPVLVFSIPIRLATCIIAVAAFITWKDWRTLPLALMFFLMTFRQILTLLVRAGTIERTSLTTSLSELPAFITSLLALTSIIYLWKLFSYHQKLEKTEKELAFAEDKFRIMAEFSSDWGAWQLPDGSYCYITPSCEKITGYTPDEFIADPDLRLKIVFPDDREKMVVHFRQHTSKEYKKDELLFRIVTKKGDLRWIWHICSPVILKNGEWQGRRISNMDITAKKQLAQNLENKKTQLKDAQRIAGIGQWELNLKTNRFILSEEIFNIFELDPRQVEPSFELFIERVHPDDREFVKTAYAESLENKSKCDIEHRIIVKNGNEKWIRDIFTTKYDENGNPLSSLGIVQDITAKKQLEEKALQSLHLQEECKRLDSLKTMAGAIAHRFNNSMTAIFGYLDLLEQTLPAGSPEKKYAATTLQIAREAAQIGSMMLTYVGQSTRQLDTENLADLVQDSIKKLKSQVPPAISLQFTPSSEHLYCSVDGAQIKEVIGIVLTNAIESFQENETGTIEITFGTKNYKSHDFPLACQDDELRSGLYLFCQVKDNGNGITKEDLQRIFEPFFSTKFVGRGLSLALAAGIMRNHRGALMVESIPEQGTTVKILLPATIGSEKELNRDT